MSHRMLYKTPGPVVLDCGTFETKTVADEEVDAHLAEGWHAHPLEALAAQPAADLSDLTGGDEQPAAPRKRK
jgi:hypothetical protein